MSRSKSQYVCSNCANRFTTWSGRCSVCGEWNTLEEESVEQVGSSREQASAEPAVLFPIDQLPTAKTIRLRSKVPEFDRVMGGDDPGIVVGSITLLAGNPGVGKSTLLLQVGATVTNTIYFSAEESLEQIRLRAKRLGIEKGTLRLSAERNINKIIASVVAEKPAFVVVDSIQTVYDDTISGTPGSLVQVRENCWRLQQFAKSTGTAVLLVGHVTKEGVVAGPRVMEHLVDVVLYLEGEKRTGLRVLRSDKNRFGSTEEVGIWQLGPHGYQVVEDPGKLFANLVTKNVPGRALSVTLEGSRGFLVEIQALATKTVFGYPKRTAQGIDANRLTLLLAVLESRANVPFSSHDVYVNVVGGLTVKDPGIDLAIAAAAISGLTNKPLRENLALIGEIGLLGEIRPAAEHAKRVKEAKRLGYETNRGVHSLSDLATLFPSRRS